jgi:hypothetical protein
MAPHRDIASDQSDCRRLGLNSCGLDATVPFSTVARRWQRFASNKIRFALHPDTNKNLSEEDRNRAVRSLHRLARRHDLDLGRQARADQKRPVRAIMSSNIANNGAGQPTPIWAALFARSRMCCALIGPSDLSSLSTMFIADKMSRTFCRALICVRQAKGSAKVLIAPNKRNRPMQIPEVHSAAVLPIQSLEAAHSANAAMPPRKIAFTNSPPKYANKLCLCFSGERTGSNPKSDFSLNISLPNA